MFPSVRASFCMKPSFLSTFDKNFYVDFIVFLVSHFLFQFLFGERNQNPIKYVTKNSFSEIWFGKIFIGFFFTVKGMNNKNISDIFYVSKLCGNYLWKCFFFCLKISL